MSSVDTVLLPAAEAFEWPNQAVRERKWPEAARRWAILRKAYPEHPTVWFQGVLAHIEAKELEQASDLLSAAGERFPNNPNFYLHSAELAFRRSQAAAASELFEQARQRFPTFVPVWLRSAEHAERLGQLKQAEAYNQQACLLVGDQEISAPFIQSAEIAMRAGNWEEALIRWSECRERFPSLPIGYRRAAEAARQLGRLQEARQLEFALQYGEKALPETDPLQEYHRPLSRPKVARHGTLTGFLELVWTKALLNLKSEVQRNYLSYGWWVLEPLLYMAVYYVVFGFLLSRGGPDYPLFLLSGLVPWMWFIKAVSNSSNSIIAGQNLMLQVGLSPLVFPLVTTIQATIKQLPVYVLLLAFIVIFGHAPVSYWWVLLPLVVVQLLLVSVASALVALVIPFVRDLSYLVQTGLTFLMFMSGVFYDYRSVSEEWRELFLLNPIAFLLKCYREILVDGIEPNLEVLLYWGLGGLMSWLLLLMLYKRLRYTLPRVVME